MVEFLEDLEDYVVIRKNSGRMWWSSGPKQLTIMRTCPESWILVKLLDP